MTEVLSLSQASGVQRELFRLCRNREARAEDVVAAIRKGADPTVRLSFALDLGLLGDGRTAWSPLELACAHASPAVVAAMVGLGAMASEDSSEVVLAARCNSHKGVMRILSIAGFNPYASDVHGRTPLTRLLSLSCGHRQIESYLGTWPMCDRDRASILEHAFYSKCDREIVRLLLHHHATQKPKSRTDDLLWKCAKNGQTAEQDVYNLGFFSELCRAGFQGHPDNCRVALAISQAIYDEDWIFPVLPGRRQADQATVDRMLGLLLEELCHTDMWDDAAAVAERLVTSGANLMKIDSNGRTPLNAACALHSSWEFAQRLLVPEAIDHPDRRGMAPLHNAVNMFWENTPDLVLGLLQSGADPNLPDDDGHTPLHYVCAHCTWAELELGTDLPGASGMVYAHLVRYGGDPNRRDKKGREPRQLLKKS